MQNKGVNPEKHGTVVEKGTERKLLNGELQLGSLALRIATNIEGETLPRGFRIDYSKMVTPEHDVKVHIIRSI